MIHRELPQIQTISWQRSPRILDILLVGGFHPIEKYLSNWIVSPCRGENEKRLKPHGLDNVVIILTI